MLYFVKPVRAASPNRFASAQRRWWRSLWLFTILCLFSAAPGVLVAQDAPEATQTEPQVAVTLAGFTLAPALDEDGEPVLDDDGAPVIERVPLADSLVTPGDQVLYVITLDNQTEDPALSITLGAQVAGEVLLDPFSFAGPDGLDIAWADAETPDRFRPLFEEIDGETVMTADLDTLRSLRLTLPELAPEAQFLVEYTVTLR